MTSLCVPKASDDERVGVFGMIEGRLHVIEYSDLPAELASARNVDGSRQFDAANIAVHVLDRAFVDRITGLEEGAATMPWHRAQKAVSYIDPETGQRVDPVKPNATKFEMFIFDALPLAGTATLVQTTREEVFSPIKNAEGSDSLATSQRDQVRRAARWLESCGVMVPRDSAGEPDCRIEISPLLANSPEELAEKRANLPEIRRGADVYLGPEAQ
jgi:UDP-N-acetylglucosamine/UDP-N-acetylgalactosamine diphosphorylase